MVLARVLSLLRAYSLYLYAAGFLALVLSLNEIREAHRLRQETIFALEKEIAVTRTRRGIGSAVGALVFLALVTYVTYAQLPTETQPPTVEPTPTMMVIELPTSTPVTPTPTRTRIPTRPRATALPPTPTATPTSPPAPAWRSWRLRNPRRGRRGSARRSNMAVSLRDPKTQGRRAARCAPEPADHALSVESRARVIPPPPSFRSQTPPHAATRSATCSPSGSPPRRRSRSSRRS